jgi:hypothetical protein
MKASHPAAAHSSTALGRSHVWKESGRDQRCCTENTNLIHGRLLDSPLQMPPWRHFKRLDGEQGMNTKARDMAGPLASAHFGGLARGDLQALNEIAGAFEQHAPSVLDKREPDGCRQMALASGAGRSVDRQAEARS